MRGCLGWIFLMPIVGAFVIAIVAARTCGNRGGLWRLVGVLIPLALGGIVAGFTHLFFYGIDGPTLMWWIGIVSGGLMALLGIWTAIMTEEGQSSKGEE